MGLRLFERFERIKNSVPKISIKSSFSPVFAQNCTFFADFSSQHAHFLNFFLIFVQKFGGIFI